MWDSRYNYISAGDFVDKHLMRKFSLLRFVNSYKPNGSEKLELTDSKFTFEDSLIRPLYTWDNCGNFDEQSISYENLLVPLESQPATVHTKSEGSYYDVD